MLLVVAIEDTWEFDWSKPGQLAGYAEHGRPVTTPDGKHTSLRIPEPIEVQPR